MNTPGEAINSHNALVRIDLIEITSIKETSRPGVYDMKGMVIMGDGDAIEIPFGYQEGIEGQIHDAARQWMIDHEGEYTIQPYTPPSEEETRASMPNVSARQLRLTLVRNGMSLASIDEAIAGLPEGTTKDEALIEWEYAHEFQRLSPTLNSIATALGLSQAQVDAMWSQALAA